MNAQDREQLLRVFFTGILPLFVVANLAYFGPISEWLHELDSPSSNSDAHLGWWFLVMLASCISGLLFAGNAKNSYLKFTYGVLLFLLFLLWLFISALSGAGEGIRT